MVRTQFVFEWFAGMNCIILRSQIPILPLRWRVAVKLKWYNVCLQIIQSQTCYPLIKVPSMRVNMWIISDIITYLTWQTWLPSRHTVRKPYPAPMTSLKWWCWLTLQTSLPSGRTGRKPYPAPMTSLTWWCWLTLQTSLPSRHTVRTPYPAPMTSQPWRRCWPLSLRISSRWRYHSLYQWPLQCCWSASALSSDYAQSVQKDFSSLSWHFCKSLYYWYQHLSRYLPQQRKGYKAKLLRIETLSKFSRTS